MALPRSSALRGSIRSFTFRRAGAQCRTNLRSIGRRTYASGHEAKKSSDIPWLIGSIVATVPAATWLWQQGPTPSDHGHGHKSHGDDKGSHEEEPTEKEEAKDEGDEDKEDSSDESKAESDDEGSDSDKSETSTKEDTAGSPPKDAKVSQKKGDKDAASDTTGAKNPVLNTGEKSQKAEGVAETAKIHGTVDPARPAGGQKEPDKSEESDNEDKD